MARVGPQRHRKKKKVEHGIRRGGLDVYPLCTYISAVPLAKLTTSKTNSVVMMYVLPY